MTHSPSNDACPSIKGMKASLRRTMLLFLAGLFLICMCVLMLQIVETRMLSVIAWYYLAFFAISMAMFGMTAGSLFVYFKPHLFQPERLLEHLSWIGTGIRHRGGDLDTVDCVHGARERSGHRACWCCSGSS